MARLMDAGDSGVHAGESSGEGPIVEPGKILGCRISKASERLFEAEIE